MTTMIGRVYSQYQLQLSFKEQMMMSIRTFIPSLRRGFASSAILRSNTVLKVGYVPEHFSTPLFFAKSEGYYAQAGVEPEFVPYISGTGHMIQALNEREIDVAVGLTEGFVAGLGKGQDWYKIVGTYVQSPLCWAISTGINRNDISSIADLRGGKIGVSRIGSGSYVMPFVMAVENGWSEEFEFKVLTNFKNLRNGVNDGTADAFMWELFTSKKYYDTKEIKHIGSIYTPWPSWTITAHDTAIEAESATGAISKFFTAVNKGIKYFEANPETAVEYISANLDYTAADAREWMKTVKFVDDVAIVDKAVIVDKTVGILQKAGVITNEHVRTESFTFDVKS
ncbi:hypothetical protein V1512DRAFT_286306 [Lipomyces arxii]|uniref:uncharacterized protein n=1 Tax=Lipomyces arxii TaxID=56418 RepID=UPI0034CF1CAE